MEKSKELFPFFEEIKRYLAITWDDEFTDKQILEYIFEGENHLKIELF